MSALNVWNISFGRLVGVGRGHEWREGCIRDIPLYPAQVYVRFSFSNNTNRCIKYATFYFEATNRVGDTYVKTIEVVFTGPLNHGDSIENLISQDCWLADEIADVILVKVKIEFTSGSIMLLDNDTISFEKPLGKYEVEMDGVRYGWKSVVVALIIAFIFWSIGGVICTVLSIVIAFLAIGGAYNITQKSKFN